MRRLVELHGGELGVKSEPGSGAKFWFELELPPAQAPARPVAAVVPAAPAGLAGCRVLVAEDNDVNMEVVLGMLRSFGAQASQAANGRQAVLAFEAARPELVLMDVHMPEMDGLTATRRIRVLERKRGWPHTPIVALTASAMPQDRQRCLEAGMDDVLVKPFRPEQLQRMLHEHFL